MHASMNAGSHECVCVCVLAFAFVSSVYIRAWQRISFFNMLVWPESSLSELNHNPIERISSCFRLNYIGTGELGTRTYEWLTK